MAIRVVNLKKTFWFESDKDPDKGTDDATKFEFRPLASHEMAYLNDRMTSMEGGSMRGRNEDEIMENLSASSIRTEAFKVACEAFRIALVDVKNLINDEDGTVIEFSTVHATIAGKTTQVASPVICQGVDPMIQMEAYRFIVSISRPSKAAEKNSDGASPPSS